MKKALLLILAISFATGLTAQFSSNISTQDASCWNSSDGSYLVDSIEGCFAPITIQIDSSTFTFNTLSNDGYDFINHGAGGGDDIGYSVWGGMTSSGPVYITTGTFEDSISFDTLTLYSASLLDMFVACFDANTSELMWAHSGSAGGATFTAGYGVTGVGDKAYVTGYLTGTTQIGNASITSTGGYQCYIAKMDLPTGNVDTIVQYGNAGVEEGINIHYNSGRLYVAGSFSGTAFLAGNSYASNGGQDGFVMSIDTSLATEYWAAVFGGSDNDRADDVVAYTSGGSEMRTYAVGGFSGSSTFGSQVIASSGDQDFFVGAIDTLGNWDWVESGGGTNDDFTTGIDLNSTGDRIYTAGSWSSTMTFGGSNYVASSNDDGFIAYMDTTGTVDSLYVLDGDGFEFLLDVQSIDDDYLVFTGQFNSDVSYADSTFTSNGNLDAFIGKIGPNMHEIWGKNFGGAANDRFGSVRTGAGSRIHTAGFFSADASAYQAGLISAGGVDACVTNGSIFGIVDTSFTMSGLSAGNYFINYSDSNGNSWTDTITIGAPDSILLSASITPESSGGANDGAIDLSVTGGTPGYTFIWSTGATTEDIDSLADGTYCVTVTDSNGCVQTGCFNLDTNATGGLLVTGISTNIQCFGDSNGAIDVSVSGGVSPYSYAWSNGATTQDLNNLGAGSYTVTVTDNDTSSATQTFVITEPSEIDISGVVTPPTSGTSSDGAIDVTVSGGIMPYSFAWSNTATTEDISGLSIGNYTVTVTDSNGCMAMRTFIVDTVPAMSLVSIASDVTCLNTDNGTIDLTVIGGLPPFTFNWSNGETTEDIGGLSAGAYSVTVTDSTGQVEVLTDSVGSNPIHPDPVVGPISGSPSVQAWSNYNYNVPSSFGSQFDWGVTGGVLVSAASNASVVQWNGGPDGIVFVTETDANGCIASDSLDVVILFVGIDETAENAILIYPNPSSDQINIALPEVFRNPLVELYDINGQLVYQNSINGIEHTISISNLPAGVYTMTLAQDDVLITHKVIKN